MKRPKNIVVKQRIIPELVSGSSTQSVTKQQALKTLKKFQGLSYCTTARGFTLIELLVVVLIIGILAAVAVPQYQKAVLKSRWARLQPLVESLVIAQQIYYIQHGRSADDFSKLDIDLAGAEKVTVTGNYPFTTVYKLSNGDFCAIVSRPGISCWLGEGMVFSNGKYSIGNTFGYSKWYGENEAKSLKTNYCVSFSGDNSYSYDDLCKQISGNRNATLWWGHHYAIKSN